MADNKDDHNRKANRLRRSSKSLFTSLEACTTQFKKIHRLIAFLLQYQSRIQYQYDIIDDYIYFRVKGGQPSTRDLASPILDLFCLRISDSRGSLGINFCSSVSGQGTIVQYKISKFTSQESISENLFLRYMGDEIEKVFSKLPAKSSALTSELPLL
jgi:hypothetical protein